MDIPAMKAALTEFNPTHMVHLAAAPIPMSRTMWRPTQNHEGTRILGTCGPSLGGAIVVTSTQFVCEAGYQPKRPRFQPFTSTGKQTPLTEMITREAAWIARGASSDPPPYGGRGPCVIATSSSR